MIVDARQMTPDEVDELLERYDQTDPVIQRQIFLRHVVDRANLLEVAEEFKALNEKHGYEFDSNEAEWFEKLTTALEYATPKARP